MNRNCYRLVFNKVRGAWMVAAECVRTHGKGKNTSVRCSRHRTATAATTATAVLMLAATVATPTYARPPVVMPPPNTIPIVSTTRSFVFAGSVTNPGGVPTTTSNAAGGRDSVISTNSRTLGLNWDGFSIGSASSFTFDLPDAGSRVLNRIWSNDPSVILGRLNSIARDTGGVGGQVYLINQNGILFGAGAQVNVGGLVASALGISDDLLTKGLPQNAGESLRFDWEGNATGFASNSNGFVAIDAGANITTPGGSRVVLLAPRTVENLGHINAGAGSEVILAAGGSVLLTAPADPNLRGLLVEVSPWKGKDEDGNNVSLNGSVINKADGSVNPDGSSNGSIIAPNGVVTLAALMVNQEGTIKADKAVNLNGQIMLISGSQDTTRLTVTQTGDKAEIDWKSGFNVAQGQIVEFIQPTAGAIAYNFIYDPDRTLADGSALDQAGSSTIDGVLKANGQLFLINERGINFGSEARVSASNFVASALGINSDVVDTGLFSQNYDGTGTPIPRAFHLAKDPWTEARRDEALAAFRQATINVATGATITTAENGFAILAGGQVNQAGAITTPGGQTILAAGAELYLKPPYSQVLRGFTAEVDPLIIGGQAASRGADANKVTQSGVIEAAFGNITLVGHEIVQGGTLTASTSITRNGSIRLLARDQTKGSNASVTARRELDKNTGQIVLGVPVNPTDTNNPAFIVGQVGGTLTLAAGSKTEVALDANDGRKGKNDSAGRFSKVDENNEFQRDANGNTIPWETLTLTAQQTFTPSSIEAAAAKINVEGSNGGTAGAQVLAKGGVISLTARESFTVATAFPVDAVTPLPGATPSPNASIFIGAGARLDAAGATAQKQAADLFIEVELRGDEFAGNPVQRARALRGQTARVDIRDKVGIADITGYINQIGQTLEERAATGGDIALRSEGSLIVKPDAVLDVSGGRVDYAAGKVMESRAVTRGGTTYRLNDAPVDFFYTGLATVTRDEAAYTEGRSAGSVALTGHSIALGGTLLGNTVRGERQRNLGDPAKDRYAVPKGARLSVTDASQHYQPAGPTDAERAVAFGQAQIAFITGRSTLADTLVFGDSAGPKLELSQSLVDAGFSRFNIRSDGRIDIPDGVSLKLADGGEFTASGRQIVVGGDITAPNGAITLSTRDLSTQDTADVAFPTEAKYSTLIVDGGAALSTAGRWINDFLVIDPAGPAGYQPEARHGGSITLSSAYDLQVNAGASLDVSGGARVKSDGKLETGNAGSIKLTTGGVTAAAGFGSTQSQDRRDASLFLDGALSAYALGKGGRLEIATSQIRFGQAFTQDSRDWTRAQRLAAGQVGAAFTADFLDRGGFFDFKFTGREGVTVADGVKLAPNPVSWSLANVVQTQTNSRVNRQTQTNGQTYRNQATGTPLGSFAQSLRLHPELRTAPTSLALATSSVAYGNLVIGDGAHLQVDPLGSIELESWRQLTVLGTLEAPGGRIRLTRPASQANPNGEDVSYTAAAQSRSIYLGPNSRLLAGGTTRLDASTRTLLEAGQSADALRAQGLYRGQVLAGGSVELETQQGYLITRPGSLIDVSGASDSLNYAHNLGRRLSYAAQNTGSAGGNVSFAARDGFFLDGSFNAAGTAGAPGGVFSLRFAAVAGNPWAPSLEVSAAEGAALSGPRQLTLFQSVGSHPEQWPTGIQQDAYLAEAALLDTVQYNGKARLDLAPLAAGAGGFGSWYLQSQGEIGFEGTINASVANQLRLDAPVFTARSAAVDVTLAAAAIQLGNFGSDQGATPATGAATLKTVTRDLALVGNFSWSGFGVTTFASKGELHFDSMPSNGVFNGVLRATGSVEFSAARLSPSTFSDFTVDLSTDPAGEINITRPSAAAAEALGPLLSAAGQLEFKAQTIKHRGRIEAPLGKIVFSAPPDVVNPDGSITPGGSVTLGKESITSVAADSALPLGQTSQSGLLWEFVAGVATLKITAAPEKVVRVDAANSTVEPGATIDLSGGGEAFAWEFTPGPGGKTDVLAPAVPAAGQEPTVFAILPGWSGNFAPADSHNQAGYNASVTSSGAASAIPSLKPGDQVEFAVNLAGLSGLSNLTAGRYTLLPARYALLPGAVLVSVKPTQDIAVAQPQTQADGSWQVAGRRVAANADGTYSAYAARPLILELAPQSVLLQRAKYVETTASGFFYDQPGVQLPGDAGRLAVAGRTTLAFDPVLQGRRDNLIQSGDGRARAGRGIELDLAAPKLEVTDAGTTASGIGWSSFDKGKLNALGVSSLLLGGLRSVAGATTNIETVSTEVRIATSGADIAKDALQAPEILLTATDNVTIAARSLLAANDDGNGAAPAQDFVLDGDGAFARIANDAQAKLERTGTVPRTAGDFVLEDDATVSGRALIFDATNVNTLAGAVKLRNAGETDTASTGGALTIGAKRINVVGDSSVPSDGLTLDNERLAEFSGADQLRLTSYSTLDLYGDAVLGTASLKELVINAAGIAGHGGATQTASVAAQSVVFENSNSGSAEFTGIALGSGTLAVTAQTVTFGDNATQARREAEQTGFALRGFSEVKLSAAQEVRFEGRGVTMIDNALDNGLTGAAKLVYGGDGKAAKLTLDAGRVVVTGAADHLIRASGAGAVTGGGNTGAVAGLGLGGRLDLRADALDISGRIVAPAGRIALTASGAGKHVTIQDKAVVAAEGVKVVFADTAAYAPGGTIILKSDSGNVAVDKGAIVSVSADPAGGDAGRLSLVAEKGTVSAADGTLYGSATAGNNQGELSVDAKAVDVDGLAAAVGTQTLTDGTTSAQFSGGWDIRRGEGDIALTKTVKAARVRFATDNGSIDITGKIDASGPKGGEIELYARNGDVTLSATGQLLAKGTDFIENINNAGTRGRGGRVTLGASGTGKVVTLAGSLIDVGVATRLRADGTIESSSAARGGKVVLRAPRSASITNKTDLNIQLAGTISGASDVSAEIVSSYTGTSLSATTGTTSGPILRLSGGTGATGSIQNDLNAIYTAANMTTLRSHLGFINAMGVSDASRHVRPGVEITTPVGSTSDFTISNDLAFNALRFQGEAGVLSIRALRDLKIDGTLSDGFANATRTDASGVSLNTSGDAWSYRLVAGADTTAANPLAIIAPSVSGATTASDSIGLKGSIDVATGKLVRTGVGDIALAARRDIKLLDRAAVYTAGRRDTTHPDNFRANNVGIPMPGFRGVFPILGGNVALTAGERILMVKTGESAPDQRHVNEWLQRASSATVNTQWWSRIGSFQQGFAAFGGGDIRLSAGTDIKNVTVAIPTSGRVPRVAGEERVDLARIEGGGDLTVRAGGSVEGGLFYAETGRLRIEAGKEVKANTAIALGNAEASIVAGAGAALGDVFNPLWVGQQYVQDSGSKYIFVSPQYAIRIGTYGEDTGLNLLSLSGNVALNGTGIYGSPNSVNDVLQNVAPSRVKIVALGGDISGGITQAPGPDGQLDLLASGSITTSSIRQLDVPANLLPSIRTPRLAGDVNTLLSATAAVNKYAATPWHQNDLKPEPSRLIALGGDIRSPGNSTVDLNDDVVNVAEFNEPIRVEAAGDILNLSLISQHLYAADVTRITAGGKIIFPANRTENQTARFQVNGPGRLEVITGGDINLGTGVGIITRGNLENPFLPEGGASVFVLAGGKPDYAGFRRYLGISDSASDAVGGDAVLRDRFYDLLREQGRAALAGGGEASYEQGRAAIRALFPAASISGGDIGFFYSQIKTEQGGGIDLLAPGGGVTVGIANPEADLNKEAANQGLFTVRGGDIRALVRDNFLVNQSRVFTLDGGDILVWADKGNIDAGSGAKTVGATPPPTLVIRNGQIVLDTANSVAGSGIGVLATRADTPPSDLDLFAPQGDIDAGDAGLRSTGNVNLGAQRVLNSDNIKAAGSVAGAPVAPPSVPPPAVPTNPAGDDRSSDDQAARVAANAGAANSLLTVEVIGLGDGVVEDEDEDEKEKECKKSGKGCKKRN